MIVLIDKLNWRAWRTNVFVRCPKCRQEFMVHDRHTVDTDGTVTPSLQCADSSCSFHDNVKLEGWESERWPQ